MLCLQWLCCADDTAHWMTLLVVVDEFFRVAMTRLSLVVDTAQCQSEMKSSSFPSFLLSFLSFIHLHCFTSLSLTDFSRPSLCLSLLLLYSIVSFQSMLNSPVVRPRAAEMHRELRELTVLPVVVWFCFRAPVIALPEKEKKGIFYGVNSKQWREGERERERRNLVTPVGEKQ